MNYKFRTWKDRLRMNEELSVMETSFYHNWMKRSTLSSNMTESEARAVLLRSGRTTRTTGRYLIIHTIRIKRIDEISEELLPLQKERMGSRLKSRIKYIAELIYGESEKEVSKRQEVRDHTVGVGV